MSGKKEAPRPTPTLQVRVFVDGRCYEATVDGPISVYGKGK